MRKIVKLFERGSVSVFGLRGKGKDLLTANVVVRRNKPYVSNVNYGGKWYPLELAKLDCGNSYRDFISGKLNYYKYPYPDGTDVYISDAGVYFPSQYCNQLNNAYPTLATFQALSRHIGNCSMHVNSQALNRVYDKIREQSEIYIRCMRCKVLFGKLVIQRVYIYEKYQSAADCVPLFSLPLSAFLVGGMQTYMLAKQHYRITYGEIRPRTLIYINKSKYNTRLFKELLENGKKTA